MIIEQLDRHFLSLFLIVGFTMKLWNNRGSMDKSLRYYWLTVISTLVLIAADALEFWAQADPGRRFWRTLFSVIGYMMRPTAALSIVLIIYPALRRPFWLWIPSLLNAAVYCTAFFSPVAFYFGDEYHFIRGPLGFTAYIVSFLYILFAVFLTWRTFRSKDHTGARFVLYLCAAACVAAALIDMEREGTHVNAAIVISSIFLYMFLRSIDTNRDQLTGLLNRSTFYEDSARLGPMVSAVGSIDMNGLKNINDSAGHEAGDEALRIIGKSIGAVSNRNILAYRTGGDEFELIFIRQDEEAVKQAIEKVERAVSGKGYSVATGYAMRGEALASIKDLIRWADEKMYASKAAYYRENQHDRRKNR